MSNDRERLERFILQLTGMDIDGLVSRPGDWGPINFEEGRKDLETVRELAGVMGGVVIEKIPEYVVPQLTRAFESAANAVAQISSYNLQSGRDPTQERNSRLGNLTSAVQELHNQLHAWVPYLAYLRGDIPLQLEAIASTVGSTHLAAAEFQRELEKTRAELEEYVAAQRASIDKALEGAREASAREGVGHFAQVFSQEAQDRSGDARKWLAASLTAVIVTIAAAVVFLLVALPSAPAQAVQYATSKVIVLAMLIGVTTWCAGNYKANMHQSVVSRRKAHALKTFQAFVEASDNPAVRDAVLLETTRSIFSQAQTGYLKSDGTADSPSQIVEIIKTSDSGQK